MASHFCTELSNDIGKLYGNKFNSDVIIHGLIPFIRFYQISAKDFQKEITTFKYLLSEELFQNVSNHHQNFRNSQNIQTLDYYDIDNDLIDHVKTNESFLFLFDNDSNKNKIARVDNSYSSHAISYINSKGPCFGYGWDLVIYDNTIEICFTYNYFDSAGFLDNNNIQELEDYEVFKVLNI
ncbi:3296_t:CDS:2 [Diversispora eburnea]|uniref:3296_t:CDS:1 n=1 Tax=Diversispora eburnea TaxID=1213867 RepID=A0A9N9AXM6_9GLOM|nr:3296_t:CDS:2 [Diversispora eburnea]